MPPFAARRFLSSRHTLAPPQVMNGKDADAKTAHATKAPRRRRSRGARSPSARARSLPRRARPQVFASIARIDDKQIDATVDKMEQEPADILLKYVYRGLEEPTDNNASLFKWQAKILDKFGIGSVVRVLTDRKTV